MDTDVCVEEAKKLDSSESGTSRFDFSKLPRYEGITLEEAGAMLSDEKKKVDTLDRRYREGWILKHMPLKTKHYNQLEDSNLEIGKIRRGLEGSLYEIPSLMKEDLESLKTQIDRMEIEYGGNVEMKFKDAPIIPKYLYILGTCFTGK